MKLTDIFLQASKDFASRSLHGKGYQAYIFLGFKIVKDNRTEVVNIFDPIKSGNYYTQVSDQDYELFCQHGWRKAILLLTLKKYKLKLELLKDKIRDEKNGSNSSKALEVFKATRQTVLNKYHKLTLKLQEL